MTVINIPGVKELSAVIGLGDYHNSSSPFY